MKLINKYIIMMNLITFFDEGFYSSFVSSIVLLYTQLISSSYRSATWFCLPSSIGCVTANQRTRAGEGQDNSCLSYLSEK